MHRVADVVYDLLANLPFCVKVSAARNQSTAESCLPAPVLDREIQCEAEAIGGISETEQLVQGIAEPSRGNPLGGSKIVQSVPGVVSVHAQIWQQIVVSETDAGVIIGQRLARGFQFRALS